jgi:precorrin-6Y C5,15-methyltransferase (decarboxylating)
VKKIHVIGIGFRPLCGSARDALRESDVILGNEGLLEAFKLYEDYETVREKITLKENARKTIDYIRDNREKQVISVLAAGDPMFFGIGRMVVNEFGKDPVELYPDLSSLQVAFSRIKEAWGGALLISLHGGPDPENRRKPKYELSELPGLLELHGRIGILTDGVNSPEAISRFLGTIPDFRHVPVKIFVCERLGLPDEKITGGSIESISGRSFSRPNVVIILKEA